MLFGTKYIREIFGFRSDEYSLSNDEFHMVVFTRIGDLNVFPFYIYNHYNWKAKV
jgi:hypothetical protein